MAARSHTTSACVRWSTAAFLEKLWPKKPFPLHMRCTSQDHNSYNSALQGTRRQRHWTLSHHPLDALVAPPKHGESVSVLGQIFPLSSFCQKSGNPNINIDGKTSKLTTHSCLSTRHFVPTQQEKARPLQSWWSCFEPPLWTSWVRQKNNPSATCVCVRVPPPKWT